MLIADVNIGDVIDIGFPTSLLYRTLLRLTL
jgi:hypothetical protein